MKGKDVAGGKPTAGLGPQPKKKEDESAGYLLPTSESGGARPGRRIPTRQYSVPSRRGRRREIEMNLFRR